MNDQIGTNQSACPDFNTLAAYLDDSLDEKEKQGVDSHLRSCRRCREIFNFGELTRQSQVELDNTQPQSTDLDPLLHRLIPFGQLSTGQTVGRYIIVEPLGLGGMGEVYSAYDPELNRRVALKLLRTDVFADATQDKNVSRLMKEAQAMAQLSHPNVISVYDVMRIEGRVVIAMEYLSGGTVKSWLEKQPRSWREIVEVFIAAGQGLVAAHAANLVHRDFKPTNVLMTEDGRVCVTDFGLVRELDQDEHLSHLESLAPPNQWEESITKTGTFIGTPAYMSPEQMLGEKSDTRSDQFCFCVALFEALYHQRPYSGETLEELKQSVLAGKIASVDPVSEVPEWLLSVIKRGLAVKPKDRHPSMEALLAELQNDPEQEEKIRRALRSRRFGWMTIILLSLILPIGVWYGLRYRTVQLCKDAPEAFAGVWDNQSKQSIRKAFLATGKPYAQGTWERVERNFDKYQKEWRSMRSEVCEARHIHGTESEELFDLRMKCLKQRRQELKALSQVFTVADLEVVENAVQASSSLTGIDICADDRALHSPYPPPKTKDQKARVAVVREKLAEVEALNKSGKYQKGVEVVEKLKEHATAVDYTPVLAEVLFWQGLLLERIGEYNKAEAALHRAADLAGSSKDSLLLAKVMSSLVYVIGWRLSRYLEGLVIARDTGLLLNVAGGDDNNRHVLLGYIGLILYGKGDYDKSLEKYLESLSIAQRSLGAEHHLVAKLLNRIGVLYWSRSEYGKALMSLRKALKIQETALGPQHPVLADTMNNIGLVLRNQGKNDMALKYYNKVLTIEAKTRGLEHPEVANTLNNMGQVAESIGEYNKALEYDRKALAIQEKKLGSEHPAIATSLNNIGSVLGTQGNYADSLECLNRALSIRKKAFGPDHLLVGTTLLNLGSVYKAKHEYDRSLELLNRSLMIWEKVLGLQNTRLIYSLSIIGSVYIDKGVPQKALEPLERVVNICGIKTCDPEPYGKGLFSLACALVRTGGDKKRAIMLAAKTKVVFEKLPKRFKKELQEVDAWLKKHNKGKPTTTR